MGFEISRRTALAMGASAAAATVLPARIASAQAAKNNSADLIKAFTGGKTAAAGKVKLDLPEIAENGNTVPMTITVESTKDAYVTDLLVVADANPQGGVAQFHFTAESVAEVNTRIRAAETQNVIAVAKMNDGSFFTASREVKVTIGGCGG
jgi:sulfur-oxidizing protein SoxY